MKTRDWTLASHIAERDLTASSFDRIKILIATVRHIWSSRKTSEQDVDASVLKRSLRSRTMSTKSRNHRFAQRFQSTHNKSWAAWPGWAQFDVFTAEQLEHEEDTESRGVSSCLSQVLLKSTFMSCTVHWNFAPKWRQFVQEDIVLIMKKELMKCSSGSLCWMSLTY